MKKLITFYFLFLTLTTFAQVLQENMWVTNGYVNVVQRSGNTVYVGGLFTEVGLPTPRGAAVDATTGSLDMNYVRPNNTVRAVVPDGSGGWYIGGEFTSVGGQTRNRLAHIKADGSLDNNWNPNANGIVDALAVYGGVVYIGGRFTTIGVTPRNYIAAVDATTGNVTGWNPNANSWVSALAVSGDGATVYAGGLFNGASSIGGQNRDRIAALNAATGAAENWNPGANYQVMALAVAGNKLYVGGAFYGTSSIGGQDRNRIAAFDLTTGDLTGWNPNSDGYIYALAVSGDGTKVYVGGDFYYIDGKSRKSIAALDANATAIGDYATSWNPNSNLSVYTLAVAGNTIYAGGFFTTMNGKTRQKVAALNAATGDAEDWNPSANINDLVYALAVAGGKVYIGGSFTILSATARRNLAAFDAGTGTATAFNPNADNAVYALAVDGTKVYAGGDFGTIGGVSRINIAALDAATGVAIPTWNTANTNTGGGIRALAVAADGTVYAGGNFTNIGGQSRNYIAALDKASGNAITAFNANANGLVKALAVAADGTVYTGGIFTSIGGQTRNRIAALNAATGAAENWNPDANSTVNALAVKGNTVYAGGNFTTIGGQTRNMIAALNAATGAAEDWNPNANGQVNAIAVAGSTIFAGGIFNTIGGGLRNRVAALDATTGLATSWDAGADNPDVFALAAASGAVYVGGQFTQIQSQNRPSFAAFEEIPGWLPVTFGPIEAFIKGGELTVNWTSLTEINNHHYEIEASADGVHFQKIGESVLSKAKDGNNSSPLHYSFNYQTGAGLMAVSLLGFAAMLFSGGKRKRGWQLIMLIVLSIGYISCSKSDFDAIDSSHKKLFIRIAQVDKDGVKTYSKVVLVNVVDGR